MKFSDGNDPPTSDILVKNCQNSRSVSESGIARLTCAAEMDSGTTNAAKAKRRRTTSADRRGRGMERKDITPPSRERQEPELWYMAADRQGGPHSSAVNEPICRDTVAWPAGGWRATFPPTITQETRRCAIPITTKLASL